MSARQKSSRLSSKRDQYVCDWNAEPNILFASSWALSFCVSLTDFQYDGSINKTAAGTEGGSFLASRFKIATSLDESRCLRANVRKSFFFEYFGFLNQFANTTAMVHMAIKTMIDANVQRKIEDQGVFTLSYPWGRNISAQRNDNR